MNLCGKVITLYRIVLNDVLLIVLNNVQTDRNVNTVTCLYRNFNIKLIYQSKRFINEITLINENFKLKVYR